MLENIKNKIRLLIQNVRSFIYESEGMRNTYCIPCTWTFKGMVYVEAPNEELAKAYVKARKINPDIQNCTYSKMDPDTEHPIICECGNCGNEYIVSAYHIPKSCPYCGTGVA